MAIFINELLRLLKWSLTKYSYEIIQYYPVNIVVGPWKSALCKVKVR